MYTLPLAGPSSAVHLAVVLAVGAWAGSKKALVSAKNIYQKLQSIEI